jgi:hypothetical protein
MTRTLLGILAGVAVGAVTTVTAYAYGADTAPTHTVPAHAAHTPPASAPVIVQCVETVDTHGRASLSHCDTGVANRAAMVCARAAFLADDYAHTHTRPAGYRRAIRACADSVGGF